MSKDIRIVIATHKSYWMPEDSMYLPIQVGAEGKNIDLGFQKDNTGDNISKKNNNYCELTGLYWAWKNLKADYIGIAHYRRHFSYRGARGKKQERILTHEKAAELVQKSDIILPKQRYYVIESNYSQYSHAHHAIDLDTTRDIIMEKYPSYIPFFDRSMKSTHGHRFNMFIMKYDRFCEYCTWLFDILFELEKRTNLSGYDTYEARLFGFMSERLFNVWLERQNLKKCEVPVVFLEDIDWPKKIAEFLKRKVTGKR